jgi:hypothetical protein
MSFPLTEADMVTTPPHTRKRKKYETVSLAHLGDPGRSSPKSENREQARMVLA